MPLWRTFPGVWQVASDRAQSHGLLCRPLAETVADTWSWMQQGGMGAQDERSAEIGISPDREQEILASVA
jgi:hypothetical protein